MGGKSCPLCIVAMALLVIGGLNWGLVGLLNLNLVNAIFGGMPIVEKIIYILVGLAALKGLLLLAGMCGCECEKKK